MTYECDLIACNTRFQKAKEKLWTFTYPNKSQAQLDYILVNTKWRNSVKDCQAYNSFGPLNSDHRNVSTKMQLSLRSNKKVKAKSNLPHDWQLFKSDCSIKEAYTVEVNNRFEALYQDIENPTANEIYSALIEAHEGYSSHEIRTKEKGQEETGAMGKRKDQGETEMP